MDRFKTIKNRLKDLSIAIKLNSETPADKEKVITPQYPEKDGTTS